METIRLQPSRGRARCEDPPLDRFVEAPDTRPWDGALMARVLDELDYGLMLVTAGCHLVHANATGARELRDGSVVRVVSGAVRPRNERLVRSFSAAVARAATGLRTLVTLDAAKGSGALAMVPIPSDVAYGGRVLLVFGKNQLCEALSIDFFSRSHGITDAEGRVLQGLCAGLPPASIASAAGVAVSTIRTHISSIRGKTGASSISHLMNRIATLPPIVGAALSRIR